MRVVLWKSSQPTPVQKAETRKERIERLVSELVALASANLSAGSPWLAASAALDSAKGKALTNELAGLGVPVTPRGLAMALVEAPR